MGEWSVWYFGAIFEESRIGFSFHEFFLLLLEVEKDIIIGERGKTKFNNDSVTLVSQPAHHYSKAKCRLLFWCLFYLVIPSLFTLYPSKPAAYYHFQLVDLNLNVPLSRIV
jgi:hypothetical protein